MSTNWSQEHCDFSSHSKRASEHELRLHPKSPAPLEKFQGDDLLTERVLATFPFSGYFRWKTLLMGLMGLEVMFAALAVGALIFFLRVAIFGNLASVMTSVGVLAAFGVGHYLLWRGGFARFARGVGPGK